jgi:predicted RNA-binding protein Jag
MKILFTLIVLIASVYLLAPKDVLQKLTLFLPQNQIEQAAETVLSDVDKKLEQFKAKLLGSKDSRITQLEKQLATLQAQLVAQEEKYKLADSQNNEKAQQPLPVAQLLLTQAKALVTNNTNLSIEESDKQRAIKRQAYLQDLVERMNKTSLLTLTN